MNDRGALDNVGHIDYTTTMNIDLLAEHASIVLGMLEVS